MKILRLRVKNSIGFKKGLNLDFVDLDFSHLQGLTAFSGKNGSAKSTCLEMLHPYSRLVSRKGSLQSHFYNRDGYKELSFEFQSATYKTLIKIDSESGRTEGYAWKNGASLLDGKISNYNKWVISLFGSPELFFNSVFCSQGSKKISDLTTGDLKKLFSEFLRLETLEQHEDTSKQCSNLLTSRAASIERDIESLKLLTEGYAEADALLSYAKGEKTDLEQNLFELSEYLKESEAELSTVRADIQKNEMIQAELDGLQATQDRLTAEIEKDQKQSETELNELREKYTILNLDIVNLGDLLANSIEIREAANLAETLKKDIAKTESSLKDASRFYLATLGDVSKKESEIAGLHLKHERLTGKIKKEKAALKIKLDHAQLKLVDLEKRDPDCVSKTCSFILSALSAQKDIPELELQVTESIEGIAKVEKAYSDTRNNFNADMRALRDTESVQKAKKEEIEVKIAKFENKLTQIETLADELPGVETALVRKTDLEKRQAENIAAGKRAKDFWEKRIIEKKGQYFAAVEIVKEKKAEIKMMAEEMFGIVGQDISSFKTAITERTSEIADKIAEIAGHEQDVARREQAQNELMDKTAKRGLAVNEASDWLYLKDACSAKGLRALEIDSVLPAIASYANELLVDTFGTRYTVRFQTQNEETGREILDIIVISDDGSEILLESLSGGERTWILSALRLSLTLISQEKSGKSFQTGFADESDGALDVGHAIEYVQMYRAFMKVGGFENFYFISHKSETIALADHVLKFGHGAIAIE